MSCAASRSLKHLCPKLHKPCVIKPVCCDNSLNLETCSTSMTQTECNTIKTNEIKSKTGSEINVSTNVNVRGSMTVCGNLNVNCIKPKSGDEVIIGGTLVNNNQRISNIVITNDSGTTIIEENTIERLYIYTANVGTHIYQLPTPTNTGYMITFKNSGSGSALVEIEDVSSIDATSGTTKELNIGEFAKFIYVDLGGMIGLQWVQIG